MFTLGQIAAFIIAAVGLTLTILNVIDKVTVMLERTGKKWIMSLQK